LRLNKYAITKKSTPKRMTDTAIYTNIKLVVKVAPNSVRSKEKKLDNVASISSGKDNVLYVRRISTLRNSVDVCEPGISPVIFCILRGNMPAGIYAPIKKPISALKMPVKAALAALDLKKLITHNISATAERVPNNNMPVSSRKSTNPIIRVVKITRYKNPSVITKKHRIKVTIKADRK